MDEKQQVDWDVRPPSLEGVADLDLEAAHRFIAMFAHLIWQMGRSIRENYPGLSTDYTENFAVLKALAGEQGEHMANLAKVAVRIDRNLKNVDRHETPYAAILTTEAMCDLVAALADCVGVEVERPPVGNAELQEKRHAASRALKRRVQDEWLANWRRWKGKRPAAIYFWDKLKTEAQAANEELSVKQGTVYDWIVECAKKNNIYIR